MQSRVYSVGKVEAESLVGIPENPRIIKVSAEGWVPTSGWSQASLAPFMYIAPPGDGLLDLDFVATAPSGIVLQVFSPIVVMATVPVPNWVRGVRVHSSTNVAETIVDGLDPIDGTSDDEVLPWPWWGPKAKG